LSTDLSGQWSADISVSNFNLQVCFRSIPPKELPKMCILRCYDNTQNVKRVQKFGPCGGTEIRPNHNLSGGRACSHGQ